MPYIIRMSHFLAVIVINSLVGTETEDASEDVRNECCKRDCQADIDIIKIENNTACDCSAPSPLGAWCCLVGVPDMTAALCMALRHPTAHNWRDRAEPGQLEHQCLGQ